MDKIAQLDTNKMHGPSAGNGETREADVVSVRRLEYSQCTAMATFHEMQPRSAILLEGPLLGPYQTKQSGKILQSNFSNLNALGEVAILALPFEPHILW